MPFALLFYVFRELRDICSQKNRQETPYIKGKF